MGDAAAIEDLYRRQYRRFLRVATAVAGSPEAAADAVPEGFARALTFMRYFESVPFELGFEAQTHRGGRVQLGGLTTPVDGCEVQETYGHVWPDPHGYHSAVEIAFDARARRFFADRAAARELALYLRWSEHHLHAPTTGITIARHGSKTTYSVRSTTGTVFSVTKHGKQIVSQNVESYAGPV